MSRSWFVRKPDHKLIPVLLFIFLPALVALLLIMTQNSAGYPVASKVAPMRVQH
jgi:hypothetical protein